MDKHFPCDCFKSRYNGQEWPELLIHNEEQDINCDGWKKLLNLIDEAANDGRKVFEPNKDIPPEEWIKIITLPPAISKLKKVKKLYLYGSNLVRIPVEIGEMESLEYFDPYTSYHLHWFPYEITRCPKLTDSRVSTRALYGNFKHRPPFPRLIDKEPLWPSEKVTSCSICGNPVTIENLHRYWISHLVATDVLPLLVNACSEECLSKLPKPVKKSTRDYISNPHKGGLEIKQPPTEWEIFTNKPKKPWWKFW